MRGLLIAAVLVGCGSDPSSALHVVETCTGYPGGCEHACAAMPTANGPPCQGTDPAADPSVRQFHCGATSTVDGAMGCCVPVGGGSAGIVLRFYECP